MSIVTAHPRRRGNTSDTAKAESYYKAMFGWSANTSSGGGMT